LHFPRLPTYCKYVLAFTAILSSSASDAMAQPGGSQGSRGQTNSGNIPVLRGSPVPTTRPAGIGENSAEELPKLRGLGSENATAKETIDSLANEVTNSSGSIFVDAEKVFVKPPVLKSLITLNEGSPLSIDAEQSIDITLRDVLNSALSNNLPIKISQSSNQERKWNYIEALSGFSAIANK
jgi:hypothetical protein